MTMMTIMTKNGIAEAKKMIAYVTAQGWLKDDKFFCPTEYDNYRRQWVKETGNAIPAWATLKKSAKEIGLLSEVVPFEWHSDGSALAAICGIAEGTIFYHTIYYFT